MVYFLHMNGKIEGSWTMLSTIFTVVFVAIAIAGTLWVMFHMNANMMPPTIRRSPPPGSRPLPLAAPATRRPDAGAGRGARYSAARRPHFPLILAMLTAVGIALFLGFVGAGRMAGATPVLEARPHRARGPAPEGPAQPLPRLCNGLK